MRDQIAKLQSEAEAKLATLATAAEVEEWLRTYAGRKSKLSQILRGLKDLSAEERKEVGALANTVREKLEASGNKKYTQLADKELNQQLEAEFLDVTLPGIAPQTKGNLHPLTKERNRVEEIFKLMGFTIWEPYMLDDDYHNFSSVNIPEGHPARDMWDTIRVTDDLSLIVHTSSMQNRVISSSEPPIRALVPGKTFRNEATDARHEHSFLQVEGVYVDRGIKLSDLIGTLHTFLEAYFEKEVAIKIQPTYFPFVEPGLEIMMECPVCEGQKTPGCEGCGGSGWMEIIPCGPIHPAVIKEAGLDPEVYTGFAWGFGLDRLIMKRTGINDVRLFHSADLDFINQY